MKAIEYSKTEQKLIEVRTYGSGDDFWCAVVHDYNKNLLILKCIDSKGLPNGYVIEKKENIESIDIDNKYCKSLQSNYDIIDTSIFNISLILNPDDNIENIISFFNNSLLEIGIGDNNYVISCRILELKSKWLEIAPIEVNKVEDGRSFYRINDLNTIRVK